MISLTLRWAATIMNYEGAIKKIASCNVESQAIHAALLDLFNFKRERGSGLWPGWRGFYGSFF